MHNLADVLYQKLLLDLESHIDLQPSGWTVDSTPKEAACYALRASLLKKFNELDNPPHDACVAALEKFRRVNEKCLKWEFCPELRWEEEVLNLVRDTVASFWYGDNGPLVSDYRQCFVEGKPGPGASLGTRSKDFYSKFFDSALSATPDLIPTWDQCVVGNDLFYEAELLRAVRHGTKAVTASKYSFVNKTRTVARGICTEPSVNMWMQLGTGAILTRRLKSFFGIDLSNQPDKNRELARQGSIFESFATIDLESASDSMSNKMLRWLLPRSFFGVLKSLRCPTTELPSGEVLELNMVSTMGNGFTFPLQTMIFSSVVMAVYKYFGLPFTRATSCTLGSYGIFGDDIIVVTRAAHFVERVLNLLGFVVNSDKSFVEGPFRESCGADYFLGFNVRGVYIKRLKTLQDLFVAINLLNRWSAKSQVFLPECVTYLLGFIRNPERFLVPPYEDDAAGLHVPRRMIPNAYINKSHRFHTGGHHYRSHVPHPSVLTVEDGVILFGRRVERTWINNPGLLITLLFGGIRRGRITLRQQEVRYKTKRCFTSTWCDAILRPLEEPPGASSIKHFVNACETNFVSLVSEA